MALAKKTTKRNATNERKQEDEDCASDSDDDLSLDGFLDGASSMDSNNNKSSSCSATSSTKPKTPYKHIPHCLKPPEVVEKRNARERKRVRAVNEAFYKLRACVPIENRNKRVSKVKTLQRAIDYIRKLEIILESDDLDSEAAASLLNQAAHANQQQQRKTRQQNQGAKTSKSQAKSASGKTNKSRAAANSANLPITGPSVVASSALTTYPLGSATSYENNNEQTSQQATSYLIEAPSLVYPEHELHQQQQHQSHCDTNAYLNSHYELNCQPKQHLVQYGQLDQYQCQAANSSHANQTPSYAPANIQVAGQSSPASYANQAQFQTTTTQTSASNLPRWKPQATPSPSLQHHYSTPSPIRGASKILASPLKITSSNQQSLDSGKTGSSIGCSASPLSTSTNSSCSPRVDSTTQLTIKSTAGTQPQIHQQQGVRGDKLQENSPLQTQPDSSSMLQSQANNNSIQKNGDRGQSASIVCHSTASSSSSVPSNALASCHSTHNTSGQLNNGGLANNLSDNQQQPLVELHYQGDRPSANGSSYTGPNQLIVHYPGVIHTNSNGAYYPASSHSNHQNHYPHHQQQHNQSNYYSNEMHHQANQQSLYMPIEQVHWLELNGVASAESTGLNDDCTKQAATHNNLGPTNQQQQQQQSQFATAPRSANQLTPTTRPQSNNLMLLGDQHNGNNDNSNTLEAMHQYYEPQQPNQLHHNNHHHQPHQFLQESAAATGELQQQQFQSQTNINLNDYCASRHHTPAII